MFLIFIKITKEGVVFIFFSTGASPRDPITLSDDD